MMTTEVVLVDFDNDGLLDPVVASLAYKTEKLYRNQGKMAFDYQDEFDGQRDPTCDAVMGDFDADGRVDFATAQGESGTGNQVYLSTGARDTLAPMILRTDLPKNAKARGKCVFHALIQDSSYDDGRDFLGCEVVATCDTNKEATVRAALADGRAPLPRRDRRRPSRREARVESHLSPARDGQEWQRSRIGAAHSDAVAWGGAGWGRSARLLRRAGW